MRDQGPVNNERIISLDVVRGLALLGIIFFHSSIYNYANIHKIDFSNPPIIVVLMSFMALWGGIFIIYSMVVNTVQLLRRTQRGASQKIMKFASILGVAYLILHYILNIVLGRWNNDFVNNRPDMTMIASSLRSMHLTFPHITKFFDGSSLSAIAFNLVILSAVLVYLLKHGDMASEKRNYWILGVSGTMIMLLSFIRVPLFPIVTHALATKNYVLSILFSFTMANPYPLLPYLAYGIFGSMIGIMIFNSRKDLLKKIIAPLSILFITFGLIGMLNFEKTISTPDYFWYFKTNFELGVFLFLMLFVILVLESRTVLVRRMSVITWFSRACLSIYILETLVSELLRIVYFSFVHSWDQTINGCLSFGAINVVVWILLLWLWRKINFKYGLEYYLTLFFRSIGKDSTKMDFLP